MVVRGKVRFVKSVWGVKSLIEKNARAASDDFFKVFIKEAHKELTKKPIEASSSQPTALQKLSSARSDIHLQVPVAEHMASVQISHVSKESEPAPPRPGTIEIPLIGIPISVTLLGIILISLAFIFGGGYFVMKIHYLKVELDHIDHGFQELEDRLIFLQTFASHLALNYTSGNDMTNNWGFWRESHAMDWCLTEWQDQVELLQATLAETLGEVSNVLRVTSGKQLGNSATDFIVISDQHLSRLEDSLYDYSKVSRNFVFYFSFFF